MNDRSTDATGAVADAFARIYPSFQALTRALEKNGASIPFPAILVGNLLLAVLECRFLVGFGSGHSLLVLMAVVTSDCGEPLYEAEGEAAPEPPDCQGQNHHVISRPIAKEQGARGALLGEGPSHPERRSLEWACRGVAGRVEPYLDSAALCRWTQCALEALGSKDVKAPRSRLPALLRASDERVLQALAPTCEAHGVASLMGLERQEPAVAGEAHPTLAQAPEVSDAPVASQRAQAPLSSARAPEVGPPAPEPLQAGGTGALCANWSSRCTSWREVPPGGLLPCLRWQHFTRLPAPRGSGRTPRRRTAGPGPLSGGRLGSPEPAGNASAHLCSRPRGWHGRELALALSALTPQAAA